MWFPAHGISQRDEKIFYNQRSFIRRIIYSFWVWRLLLPSTPAAPNNWLIQLFFLLGSKLMINVVYVSKCEFLNFAFTGSWNWFPLVYHRGAVGLQGAIRDKIAKETQSQLKKEICVSGCLYELWLFKGEKNLNLCQKLGT